MVELDFLSIIQSIPEFNGRNGNLDTFISCVENVMKKFNNEDQPMLLDMIKLRLHGKVYECQQYKIITAWAELKNVLNWTNSLKINSTLTPCNN